MGVIPASKKAIQTAIQTIQSHTVNDDDSVILIRDFGALCDANIQSCLQEFEDSCNLKSSKEQRCAIIEEIFMDLEEVYELQVQELQLAHFEKFRQQLSKLRLGPTLPQDMDTASQTSLLEYKQDLKKMVSIQFSSYQNYKQSSALLKYYHKKIQDYTTERLQAARASGSYKPLKRKGIQLGLHW